MSTRQAAPYDKSFKDESSTFHAKCNCSRGKKGSEVPGFRLNQLLEKKNCPATDLEDMAEHQVCSLIVDALKSNDVPTNRPRQKGQTTKSAPDHMWQQ